MTDPDLDRRLKALFAEPPPSPDPDFAVRVVALAAYDLSLRRARRRGLVRIAGETAALVAVLGAFALIARLPTGKLAGFGDTIALASPAMLAVALLAMWALVATRDPATA